MRKNRIDALRKGIEVLEEKIRQHPCDCAEANGLRRELKELRDALERQEKELATEAWN